jgi:hypothetical protein
MLPTPNQNIAIPQQMQRLVGRPDLRSAVAHALLTTRATTVCQFHPDVVIRVGDDAAETHALYRAKNAVKSSDTGRSHDLLLKELARTRLRQIECVLTARQISGGLVGTPVRPIIAA